MYYTNAQLAHYLAKSCNAVREPLVEATIALNKVHTLLIEDNVFESLIGNHEITVPGDTSDSCLNSIAIISQYDIGDKYELTALVEYHTKEKLYIPLDKPVQSITVLEWLLFHFDNDMIWNVNIFD